MKNRSTWTLPDVIDPIETICVQIEVPKDDNHIAAFWGALEALNKAWNWQYTSDHKGSQTARVWQGYIDTASQNVRVGEGCDVVIDCNDVETCLDTSPIIAAINASILALQIVDTSLQGQIDDNDTDITALQIVDASLQSQITSNNIDIAQNTADIAFNLLQINQLTSDVFQNSADIAFNLLQINNNEARITALEAAGGGGGGSGGILVKNYSKAANGSTNSTAYVTNPYSLQFHQFTFPNALIMLSFVGNNLGSKLSTYLLQCDGVNGLHPIKWKDSVEDDNSAMILTEKFSGIDTSGVVEINMQFLTQTGGYAGVRPLTTFVFTIIEYPNPVFVPEMVTFDAGGGDYTLPVGQVGTVQSGGNPDNCLRGTNVFETNIAIEYDLLSTEDVTSVDLDYLCDGGSIEIQILEGGLVKASSTAIEDNTWRTVNIPTLFSGQLIEIRLRMIIGTALSLRLDNVLVNID